MGKSAPLHGLTVLELGHSVAAPYAGLILAELGARVIKVENPSTGDYARGWGPPFFNEDATAFHALNRGKESLTLDFSDPEQLALLKKLILGADAVIQNLRPGLLAKFGIDVDDMRRQAPGMIWCDIGAFGKTGPLSRKLGYDPLAQASSGIMSMTGEANRPPVRVGVSLVDMGSGMWTVIGLLAALFERSKNGEGAHVATSLFETGLAWMTIPLAAHAVAGEVRKPYGSGLAEIVPYQAFQASDGWVMIAAGNDKLFAKLCAALPGLEHLGKDERFKLNRDRVLLRDELVPQIEVAVAKLTVADLSEKLDAVGVPNCPLLTIDKVWTHPQTEAVGILTEADGYKWVGLPFTLDDERPTSGGSAPKLGAHNQTIRQES
ncbi:crotonobetainyl-CoA:carnitine CoA-transferase CaiB-like acyl-CoA transferase [Ochrobactrum daejeonense]|uniref:Crotonobetainyl-CoA:carnitine CoA-transferase CaiB-like acyl-CoA transferase n=1 Tax=Brucella daejeonensis TaxID=659015 RepID=A0A7W9EL51_9HYPH|nr:CoA transferase [Brucella daejeonensis]MBB5701967.1 crotonobetainyl-CoA:carnitine CoA-transferase CaiB-like acyl-CoA transferase [Brucella daejeonensis]